MNDKSHHCHGSDKKPLEIYMFIDPLCPECWALEPILKKLQIEYGCYFSLKYVLSGRLATLNLNSRRKFKSIAELWEKTASRSGMSCDGGVWFQNPISSPFLASVAIKAAELQGRRAGIRFLRKLREFLFLEKQNISNIDILIQCAKNANLEVEEFLSDIHSESAAKAFQCDLKITSEMEVNEIPTLVFFNENIEEEGIKVTGYYQYDVYVQVLEEMISTQLTRNEPPPLEVFLKHFKVVASKEIALVYNMTVNDVEHHMRKLILKQVVERIPVKFGTFWKYIGQ
ncbi:DsbA family protein [Bacillus aquiflavi]|uniref:ClpXP adapter protein SpxH n=1 Tax=Bacillus aquiflavi TaxID=2672567 RepID=A0A6B3VUA8_9BACI|nr:ClpXP adapter SpxH family protein [Bacillus aquiflavi]MBA4536440.1 DsbA family protein [Bacillus aquiflavi]NEY80808.1 DsbA family protein [Bacillus aquiflavi]